MFHRCRHLHYHQHLLGGTAHLHLLPHPSRTCLLQALRESRQQNLHCHHLKLHYHLSHFRLRLQLRHSSLEGAILHLHPRSLLCQSSSHQAPPQIQSRSFPDLLHCPLCRRHHRRPLHPCPPCLSYTLRPSSRHRSLHRQSLSAVQIPQLQTMIALHKQAILLNSAPFSAVWSHLLATTILPQTLMTTHASTPSRGAQIARDLASTHAQLLTTAHALMLLWDVRRDLPQILTRLRMLTRDSAGFCSEVAQTHWP
mmetsp:Transcript_14994/g.37424  ORF Transcript_14994/g.37424 Transcript_14994/m.37424 type:complete len:254 (+) Transcript_14994:810-1571(+)